MSHPKARETLAGARIQSVDEFVATAREAVREWGLVSRRAIPEQYPLLRTMQLSHNGYFRSM